MIQTTLTQPLRNEHRDLWPQVEALRTVADEIGVLSIDHLRHEVDTLHAFLMHTLIPHAHAEEAMLYPMVAQVIGAPEATATMRRDHVEIRRLTDELSELRLQLAATLEMTERQERALRRVLYGLFAVVSLHFAKEEEIFLPMLDERLTDDTAAALFAAMQESAHHELVHHT
jgi:iron-sulfur cluster repair protein YtfE (RIC family)